jgi:hypothetical protein
MPVLMLEAVDAREALQEARRDTALHLRTHFAVASSLQEGSTTRLVLMLQDGIRVYHELLSQLGCGPQEEGCTSLLGVQQLCIGKLPKPDVDCGDMSVKLLPGSAPDAIAHSQCF